MSAGPPAPADHPATERSRFRGRPTGPTRFACRTQKLIFPCTLRSSRCRCVAGVLRHVWRTNLKNLQRRFAD